jgi:uncharacterized protein (TIGR02246 family)
MTHMQKRRLIAASAALAFATPLSGSALAEPDERQVIQDRLHQYEVRFNEQNVEALAKLFGEDVVYFGPLGIVYEGRDAVKQRYRRTFEAGFSDMEIDPIEISVLGDTAWDIARYKVTGPQGESLEGYHLAILEKVDGEWIVRRTLVNAVMPTPPRE